MNGLLQSRKFWLAVFDAGTSSLLLAVALWLPEKEEFVKQFLVIWQVPFVLLITGITVEDTAQKVSTQRLLASKFGPPDEG